MSSKSCVERTIKKQADSMWHQTEKKPQIYDTKYFSFNIFIAILLLPISTARISSKKKKRSERSDPLLTLLRSFKSKKNRLMKIFDHSINVYSHFSSHEC